MRKATYARGRVAAPVAALAASCLLCVLALAPSSANAGQSLEGIPHYQHVGVLILENESESSTWGPSSPATYLKSLVPQGAFDDNYFADGHVSLDNYITMTSGQPSNVTDNTDCMGETLYMCAVPINSALYGHGMNIADQVQDAGLTWKEYADSMPSPCFHADASASNTTPDPYQGDKTSPPGNYADRHVPFIYYFDILNNSTRCQAHDLPFTQLSTDITGNSVPNYFFITPDTCHDGHDNPCAGTNPPVGGLAAADTWLHTNLPSLLTYLNTHDGVLFITNDESAPDTDISGCCTGGPGGGPGFGGKVGLLAIGPGVNAGNTIHTSYDHASLLRTTEDALGIDKHLNNASTAAAMADLFAGPAANTPDVPTPALLPLLVAPLLLILRRRRSRA